VAYSCTWYSGWPKTSATSLRLVLAQSLWILLIGLTIGVGVSLALSRLLESLLFQVEPRDLATLLIVSELLVAVALVAASIPARRASRIDPLGAL
jgi:putative ABC transport system permease protein